MINSISADKNLFKTYFELYYAQFKLFKSFVKEAISIYKQGSGGILLAYFMFLISIIRKSKLVAELKKERNIFETDSDMRGVDIARLISSIKHECIS